jgi:hypothetical protein
VELEAYDLANAKLFLLPSQSFTTAPTAHNFWGNRDRHSLTCTVVTSSHTEAMSVSLLVQTVGLFHADGFMGTEGQGTS